jgi:hypothetical protein
MQTGKYVPVEDHPQSSHVGNGAESFGRIFYIQNGPSSTPAMDILLVVFLQTDV